MLELIPASDALFLDIDGTLLDIASTPDGVIVTEALRQDLAQLHEKMGGALALISGRAIADIDALFAPLILPAAGSHGAEKRLTPAQEPETGIPVPEFLRDLISNLFKPYPGLYCQDKTYSFAVHYRNAPELEGLVHNALSELVASSQLPLRIMQGKMVFEVLGNDHTKGTALEYFMDCAPFSGRRPIYFGDDVTDLDAMECCRKLGGIAGQVGKITSAFESFFDSPEQVRNWIKEQVQ